MLREDQDCLDRNARGVWLDGYGSPGGPVIALNSRPHRHGLIRAPPVGKTRCRPGKSRSCDGQGRRSRYTTDDARPDLAQTNDPVLDKRKLESVRLDPLAWEARSRPEGGPQKQAAKKRSRVYCVHRSTACKDGATPRGTRTFKAAIWIPLSASYSPQGSAAGMTTSSTRLQTAPNLCKI